MFLLFLPFGHLRRRKVPLGTISGGWRHRGCSSRSRTSATTTTARSGSPTGRSYTRWGRSGTGGVRVGASRRRGTNFPSPLAILRYNHFDFFSSSTALSQAAAKANRLSAAAESRIDDDFLAQFYPPERHTTGTTLASLGSGTVGPHFAASLVAGIARF